MREPFISARQPNDPVDLVAIGSIGERIKYSRKKIAMKQADLAHRLGVSQPTVANWESGVHDPRQLMLAKIAEAVSASLGWLASGERSALEKDKQPAAAYLRRGLIHVPIVLMADIAGLADDSEMDFHTFATDYIPVTAGNYRVFSVFVEDPAMDLAFAGETLAVIDPSLKRPSDGDLVLMARPGQEPYVRKWRANPIRLEPMSSNPAFQPTTVESLDGVLGSVVVSIRFF